MPGSVYQLDWLRERFEKNGDHTAWIWRGQEYSYRWFLAEIDRWQETLIEHQVAAGSIVAIESDCSPAAAALLLALIECAALAVPVTGMVKAQKDHYCRIAEVQVIARFDGVKDWIIERIAQPATQALTRQLQQLQHPGLILFSSGSTGESKAALHDFARLLAKFEKPRHAYRTLVFLLFDHIGGINTLFYTLANGGTVVVAEDRSPDAVCELISRHQVELLPTTPTFLNLLLLSEAYRYHNLSSLKLITYGTEPMAAYTLHRLREELPQVELLQTYGLSELGILRSKSKSSESLWMKLGGEGYETKVVDGILWIRAQSAMLGYLNAPNPFDAEGWFNTQDAVEVEGEYFRILGRNSDLINIGGEKVYPAEIENVILSLPNIHEAVVYGETNPITGQTIVAKVVLKLPEDVLVLRQRLRAHCRQWLPEFKIPAKVLVSEASLATDRFKKQRPKHPLGKSTFGLESRF